MDIEKVTKGSKLLMNNIPFSVENVDFVKPGKGRAVYKLRLRNLLTNNILDVTYHSGDSVEETNVSTREMQYLYRDNDNYIFMDSETFEQHSIPGERIGNKSHYMKEGLSVIVVTWEETPIDMTLPITVELKVVESAMATKTDTVTAQAKMVVLETGYTLGVPTFIKEGDTIKIDTRSGNYIERVGSK
ncbi:MAG: elongation factor P [Chloroflexota bacterium]